MATSTVSKLNLGENVNATLEGDKLTLVIDLSVRLRPSASGKNVIVATTSGNQNIAGGMKIGLNVFTK